MLRTDGKEVLLPPRRSRTGHQAVGQVSQYITIMCMEEKILTINDELIARTLESLRKASRKADVLMENYKPVLHGERLMTDGELATVLRVSPRALRDYRNEGILPYIRMKGNILYKESDIEKVLKDHERKTIQ